MTYMTTKIIDKMYTKVDSIAKKGSTNYLAYYEYIDEIINNGQYALFESMMSSKYGIDITTYPTVDGVKNKTFAIVLSNTLSNFQENLYDLFNSKKLYQMGLNVYFGTQSIGQISVVDVVLKPPYPDYIDRKLSEVESIITQNLIVLSNSGTYSVIYGTSGVPLLQMYNQAISYLL